MKQKFYHYARAIAMFMVASLMLVAGCNSRENSAGVPQAKQGGETKPQAQANFDQQPQNAETQSRPEVESSRIRRDCRPETRSSD
jgi:hypothetical protein